MSPAIEQPKPAHALSDSVVTFTGADVVLAVLFESLRRAGRHPVVARAKSAARVPNVSGGDAVIMLAVMRHYLNRIGANVLGVRTRETRLSELAKERSEIDLSPVANDGLRRTTTSQTLEGS